MTRIVSVHPDDERVVDLAAHDVSPGVTMSVETLDERLVESVAAKFARFVADGDLDGLRPLYTPDARIWHNTDDK